MVLEPPREGYGVVRHFHEIWDRWLCRQLDVDDPECKACIAGLNIDDATIGLHRFALNSGGCPEDLNEIRTQTAIS
jgi:hypothetical protein